MPAAFEARTARLVLRLGEGLDADLSVMADGTVAARAPLVQPDWVWLDAFLGADRVGTVGLLFNDGEPTEIGYRIELEHRRKGYATEALGVLVALAFGPFGEAVLEAAAAEDNVPSHRTLARLGFVETGRADDRWSARRGAYIKYLRFRLERPGTRTQS